MNIGNFTQKSMEAMQSAQGLAREYGNQQLEQVHLLTALLSQEGGFAYISPVQTGTLTTGQTVRLFK